MITFFPLFCKESFPLGTLRKRPFSLRLGCPLVEFYAPHEGPVQDAGHLFDQLVDEMGILSVSVPEYYLERNNPHTNPHAVTSVGQSRQVVRGKNATSRSPCLLRVLILAFHLDWTTT